MEIGMILTVIGTGVGVWGLLNRRFDKLENRIDKLESRIDGVEERVFLLATGKTLKEAIEEQMRKKNDQ